MSMQLRLIKYHKQHMFSYDPTQMVKQYIINGSNQIYEYQYRN